MEIRRKKVDEEWKAQIEQEKELNEEPEDAAGNDPSIPSVQAIVSIFATQAMLAMGEFPHPLTGEKHIDIANAKYSIDMLEFLKKKMTGNLSSEESQYFEKVLYELKMLFVSRTGEIGTA